MPAVIAKITNEIAACVKMNVIPCRMEERMELAAPAGRKALESYLDQMEALIRATRER